MDENKIQARFDHLTKLVESIAKQIDVLEQISLMLTHPHGVIAGPVPAIHALLHGTERRGWP